jgi:predicted methyltransferase
VNRISVSLLAAAFIAALPITALPASAQGASATADASLAAAIVNPDRQQQHKVRDAHRHPAETLAFFGVKPGMTVVEIAPGSGYYAEILSPYLAKGGGKYIATGNAIGTMSDQAKWGKQTYVPMSRDSGPLAPAGTADMVVTFRNIHNWMWQQGALDKYMADFAAALKPGGVLGVEEHRADPRPMVEGASDGYVSEAHVIAAAERAGFKLDARSDINANPKDTKDHPFGVWTLPPTKRTAASGQPANPAFDRTKYDAIGESDRMTLRFRKPA